MIDTVDEEVKEKEKETQPLETLFAETQKEVKKIQEELTTDMEGKPLEEKLTKFSEIAKKLVGNNFKDDPSKGKGAEDMIDTFFGGMIPIMKKVSEMSSEALPATSENSEHKPSSNSNSKSKGKGKKGGKGTTNTNTPPQNPSNDGMQEMLKMLGPLFSGFNNPNPNPNPEPKVD